MACWSGSSPAGCISIRVTVTLSVLSDTIGGFEELDMDIFRIIISLFVIAYF
jgi:hypothetical protein